MTEKLSFSIVSPLETVFEQDVEMAVVPAHNGFIGILKDHVPLVSSLNPGIVKVYDNGRTEDSVVKSVFVSGGFVEVVPNKCVVLADEAIPIGELDEDKIMEHMEELKIALGKEENERAKELIRRKLRVKTAKIKAVRKRDSLTEGIREVEGL